MNAGSVQIEVPVTTSNLADLSAVELSRHFGRNEASIDFQGLKKDFTRQFSFKTESYRGNIAYLLVLNSMIFRMPWFLKRACSPALLRIESLIEKFQGRLLSCFVAAQWQKR